MMHDYGDQAKPAAKPRKKTAKRWNKRPKWRVAVATVLRVLLKRVE